MFILGTAARSLLAHSRQNLLLAGVLSTMTVLLLLVLGFTEGIRGSTSQMFTALAAGDINVHGVVKLSPGRAEEIIPDPAPLLAIIRREVPNVQQLSTLSVVTASLHNEAGIERELQLIGLDLAQSPAAREWLHPIAGSLDELEKPRTLLLFEGMAKRLGLSVGDVVTAYMVTPRGVHNTVDLRVAAIADNSGGALADTSAVTQSASVRELAQLPPSSVSVIQLRLPGGPPPEELDGVKERLRAAFAKEGHTFLDHTEKGQGAMIQKAESEPWLGQKLEIQRWDEEDALDSWMSSLTALDALTFVLGLLLMAIVSVGLMNSIWIAINERTREIGALRAIGLRRNQAVRLFLAEAFMLGAVSTAAGAALSLPFSALVNALAVPLPDAARTILGAGQHLHCQLELQWMARTVLLLTLGTTFIALFPSLRAARLRPVTAMHRAG